MQPSPQHRILVLSSSEADVEILKRVLSKAHDGPFRIESENSLAAGLARLADGAIDVVLVDLTLADSRGLDTFDGLFAAYPRTPIMTLTSLEEEEEAIEAVTRGAQGYLLKGHFERNLVPQALRSVIIRKEVEEALYLEKTRAEIALNSISDAVICTDIAGRVNYLNVAAETMTGWSRQDADGQPIAAVFRIINSVTREAEVNPVDLVLQQNEAMGLAANTVMIRRDGAEVPIEDSTSPIHDSNGKLTGAVVVFHDVGAAKAMSEKMAYLAHHDFLTDLPNRLLLNDRISQAITAARRRGTKVAVLFLDLDNFKHINDSLGHATGDLLLRSVTQRLSACVRSSDTVSRQGGDEFVILLSDCSDESHIASTAEKIHAALSLPHLIAKRELHVSTSMGISVYPADGADAEALIKSADTAMYYAKAKGRNNHQFFSNEMNTRAVERQFIESNLRRALKEQEFVLHYQPKVNLVTGKIIGAEALLRWQHPEWGMLLPERFVAIAEDCGLIVPLGQWVLREACSQAQRWIDAGVMPISMAVNISALEFRQKSFFENLDAILKETGLAPALLQLEITEGVLMHDASASAAILQQLKDLGLQLAIDDFGTGYSSLSYLKQFPIDVLKIDQSFVHDIGGDDDEGIIASAVIGMGNSLKLRVVAEGIENQKQLAFLKMQNCEEGQGFLFSKPVDAEQFAQLLAANVEQVG
ncbi:putative bifunctional diguanylate cyclase/phosphodiesterase [Actimicrobium sp. GrIS 1.19]|uniref:putative bifunctional diguanylate cyclase/phosphodiesterase n=1 Tax=Actimicrobium sp. GrIS 1.19 TaxID=3071708 RepID=UPI002E0E2A7A